MKKIISFILITSVAILLVFSLCACNNGDKIVGTWTMSNVDLSYGDGRQNTIFNTMASIQDGEITFNSDGTITNTNGQTAFWKYDKSTKEYLIGDTEENLEDYSRCEKAKFIDGELHIDYFIYKKA